MTNNVTLPGTGSIAETRDVGGNVHRQVVSIGDVQAAIAISSVPPITGTVAVSGTVPVSGTVALTSTAGTASELGGQLQRVADLLESILEEVRINGLILSSLSQPIPEHAGNLRGDVNAGL